MKTKLSAVFLNKIILGFLMMLVLNSVAAKAQPQKGLMSRLIEIKYSTELYLTTQMKNESNSAKKIVHLQSTIPCVGRLMDLSIN
jgi:hypothetical protein